MQGDRYFTIDSEEDTQLILSDESNMGSRFPDNMYQELIIEDNFNRERLMQSSEPNAKVTAGIRFIITPYKKRPSRSAYDACKFTDCGEE